MRYAFPLVAILIAASVAKSQESDARPFVEYDARSSEFLQALHGKKTPLAWRDDYPGGFVAWQKAARKKLRELLGLNRIAATAPEHKAKVKLGLPITEDGYQRQLGEIETEPGVKIPFWVLTPTRQSKAKRPVVLCAHGHDSDGWNTYSGVYRDDPHRVSTLAKEGNPAVQAVRQGYVAVVPATRGLANVVSIADPKGRHGNRNCRAQLIHCLLAGRTPVGERVWDIQRIIDWIVGELPGIDSRKIVMLGNSGGGVLTVHAAALDERIAVAIPSCSFTSFTSSEGFVFHCDCCLVPRAQSELCDLADIGALIAPRALLAVHGRKDGLHNFADVERAMARVRQIYRASGTRNRFDHQWGAKRHQFYPQFMWPFVKEQLAK